MDIKTRKFRGNVSCYLIPEGNATEDFGNVVRKHGADGSIAQAIGPSKISAWVGDSKYETERMAAGRANGTFPEEVIGAERRIMFDTGHDCEQAILLSGMVELQKQAWKEARMKHNATIMSVRSQIKVDVFPTPKEEYRNDAWPDVCAHTDCHIRITKGKAIPNPRFVIGSKEKNYLIVPDAEDHWYVGDAKSVQSAFSDNWNKWEEVDGHNVPVGGMKNGIASTDNRQQMLCYLVLLAPLRKFEGAFLLGSKGDGLSEDHHAQVFIPFDEQAQTEGEWLLDEASRRNRNSMKGRIPSVAECIDVKKAIAELPLQFPDVNKDRKILELDPADWKLTIDSILECEAESKRLSSLIAPYIKELREKLKEDLGITLGSLSPSMITQEIKDDNGDIINTISTKTLKEEKDEMLLRPLELVKDGPSCFYIDEATGEAYIINYGDGVKWDKLAKAAIQEDYPEVYEDLRQRFPDRTPKFGKAHERADDLKKRSRKK